MSKKIKLVDSNYIPKPSIIDRIYLFAQSKGLERRNGAFYRDNRFYGTLFDVGKESGIDMQEHK